jgi:short-subunit dehydrogenase
MRRELLYAGGGAVAGLAAAFAAARLSSGADLTGEVAVITGSSRGLGFVLAREFAREGCRIVICARDQDELDRARRELGSDTLAIRCDVTDRNQVRELIRRAKDRFGRVDILVNNAGTIQVGPVETMTVADFESAMQVMFWGVLYPTLEVLPDMLGRRSGRIVNITSIGGKVAVPHLVPYGCAKFAAVGLSEGLRAELHGDGIKVTTIVPGLMRTGSHLNAYFKGKQEREYAWFSVSASSPLVAMGAERAARQIVRAVKRGEAERVLSLPATLMARFHGLFPGLTADLLGLADRLLPSGEGGASELSRGREVHERAHSKVLTALTGLGLSAAGRYNQNPE